MNEMFSRVRSIHIVDALALVLGVLGSVASVAIFLDAFSSRNVMTIGLIITALILLGTARSSENVDINTRLKLNPLRLVTIFVIGSLSLLFRWSPYNFEQGGQDQGLYVNMATTLGRWGSVRFPDAFRQTLDSGARAIYDQTLLYSYSLIDSTKSITTIEFYPLHPAFMAMSQTVFGGLGAQSLTIFSMLGVLAAWYLAIEIDGRWSVAALFSLLIAINPALTFYAKFPVSESIALTFVLFGMLYFIRFIRAHESHKQILYLVVSLLSFNSLFYVRWQFLLYVPFFNMILIAAIIFPSYRIIRNKVAIFTGSVFALFAVSMLYYMRKQPELYAPMRDSVVDMLPASSIGILLAITAIVVILLAVIIFQSNLMGLKPQSRVLNVFTIDRFAPFALPVVMLLAIPSVISLYAGDPMYPWGYRVPAEVDSLVIRYHVGYRLALFASPMLFVIIVVGGLGKSVRNKATGLLYIFAAICFTGVLLRPTVPYLYYYGRYLSVDILPAFLLLGSAILVTWMASKKRAIRLIAGVTMMSIFVYSLLFSSILLGKHEGEDAGFFPAIAKEVTKNDVILFSNTSQQVMVPLRARYELNIVALDNLQPETTSDRVIDIFRPIAKKQGGRLLLMTPSGNDFAKLKLLGEFQFTDRYFTNTDHFRGDGLLYLESRRRVLLPTRWQSGSVTWKLFEIN
jgi:hypothetical protein